MAEKITKTLLNKIILELQKEENLNHIELEILNPLLTTFFKKFHPYLQILFTILILHFLLIISILILIILFNYKNKNINLQ